MQRNLIGVSNAHRWLGLCLLLVGCCLWEPAIAASMVDFSETEDDIFWMFGSCMLAGGLGFGVGVKIRMARDIANAA